MIPETLRKALWALRWVGLGPTFNALRYTLMRERVDRKWVHKTETTSWTSWGTITRITPHARGVRVHLERGNLDIHFLTADMVCVSWLPATPPVPYARARDRWPEVKIQVEPENAGWRIRTEYMQIILHPDGALLFYDNAGHLLRETLPPQRAGERVRDRARLRKGEVLIGLGEKTTPLNRRGHVFTLWNRDPAGYHPGDDPIYLNIPVYIGLHTAGQYLVFYENPYYATFDLGHHHPDMAEHTFNGGMLRYYVIVGSPPTLMERYTDLTGRPPLPPLWALGYHQSRYSYYPETRVREIADTFKRLDIPVDVIHLDIHYMDGYRVFTWDLERFPDPQGLAQDLREKGIRLITIVDPGIKVDDQYSVFTDGRDQKVYCKLPDGSLLRAPVWPGWCAFPDFTQPKARQWWGEQYRTLLDVGIAGFWNDMNEPATFVSWGDPTFPLATRHYLEGRGGNHQEAHNLYGLLMARASYEGLRALDPNRRHMVISRAGWAGLQRYAWHWTGDTYSDWPSLAMTIPQVIGLGMSGISFTGPDVGGFLGAPSAELYTRWLQMAAFFPFFRTHTAIGTPDQEPWSFGQPYLDINRETIRLRYRLLPYLYTLAWESHTRGWPVVRPVWWGHPDIPSLWSKEDMFMVGDHLLVAPILEEGSRERDLVLPPGEWYDFWTGIRYVGGQSVRIAAPLSRIPLFVKAGTVLPMWEPVFNVDQFDWQRLHLYIYPPGGEETTSILYTDAGEGWAYKEGEYHLDIFQVTPHDSRVKWTWTVQHNGYWPYEEVIVHFVGGVTSLQQEHHPISVQENCITVHAPGGTWVWTPESGGENFRED